MEIPWKTSSNLAPPCAPAAIHPRPLEADRVARIRRFAGAADRRHSFTLLLYLSFSLFASPSFSRSTVPPLSAPSFSQSLASRHPRFLCLFVSLLRPLLPSLSSSHSPPSTLAVFWSHPLSPTRLVYVGPRSLSLFISVSLVTAFDQFLVPRVLFVSFHFQVLPLYLVPC